MTPRAWGMLALIASLSSCYAIVRAATAPIPPGMVVCLEICDGRDLIPRSVDDVTEYLRKTAVASRSRER